MPPATLPPDAAADPRALTAVQRDALREVANIGAGHAATALSQMTGSPIMISVPLVHVAPLEAVSLRGTAGRAAGAPPDAETTPAWPVGGAIGRGSTVCGVRGSKGQNNDDKKQ